MVRACLSGSAVVCFTDHSPIIVCNLVSVKINIYDLGKDQKDVDETLRTPAAEPGLDKPFGNIIATDSIWVDRI